MTSSSTLAITLLMASALTAGFFAYLHSLRRQSYLMLWSAAWGLLALHYLSDALAPGITIAPWQSAVDLWLLAAAALLFFSAAQEYAHARPWVRVQIAAGAAFAVWTAAFHLQWIGVSPQFGIAVVLFATAWVFFAESQHQETFADLLLALSFLGWGAILTAESSLGPRAAEPLRVVEILPQLFAAAFMVMGLYEEDRRRAEGNMLALSSVNLATSSLVGPEIQKMLSQAVERVLSVVRMPAGALFLHHGNPLGPTSVVAVGLPEHFCDAAQEAGLDDRLAEVVSRLGGLVVFRDLGRDSSWAALDAEDGFRRFRQLVVSLGLHTAVGISLQAKDQTFGVLFLGTPDSRRFTPAELRLLLALGHQIGMAVENSYLIQQTTRRSEELRILNEIGCVLSSTLEPEVLFETILAEMRRLFEVNSFFIALRDPARDEIRYEIEVRDGAILPKRSRPCGEQHAAEYVMRTGQPLLIREHYAEEMRKIGLDPQGQSGCFCGVPLLLRERAIGIMAVESPQERAFDSVHVEMMRVLASEAVIALENARLFREERIKSRHLTLVNNVSRNAITTLNPDEILFKIAEELGEGLDYSHIGIGLLEHSSKEVVIQAEAGRRKGALGRRLELEGNLVGQVARSGHPAVVSYQDCSNDPVEPVLPGSVSAVAMPIIYAEQLQGVLYAETDSATDFPPEEILFLDTLADLISGALYNAMTFQRARQQAITDGLTGLKTHQFFMEALWGEWKRSTRAGRPFSMVLLDLDRFKFVNDFYGHQDGDIVLQRVANILDKNCRRSDIVARYGGDEFLILMPETDSEQSRQIATKLRSCLAADPVLHEKNVTASFGLASFPMHGSTPQELIQVADSSMYISKHQGGNAVSAADYDDPDGTKEWKRDVLEAYLSVTLKRLFYTGPDAFVEIYNRIEQFARSLSETETPAHANGDALPEPGIAGDEPLPSVVMDTLVSLALAVDSRDRLTQGHSRKVSGYAVEIAKAIGLTTQEIEEIRLGGMLHDAGKVGIAESILNKNGPLNSEEWETMKRHVEYGAKLLEPLRGTERIREIIAHHHEFYDGSGYPHGMAGNQIPLGARIVAIADAYDTITSERTYKKARSPEDAFLELGRCSGAQFDPELVRVFVSHMGTLPNPLIDSVFADEPEAVR